MGFGIALMTSISGPIKPRTLSKHSVLARKGAIWSNRLKVSEQSLGMPFDKSENALSVPPVGRLIFSGLGWRQRNLGTRR